ncbi:hypothetical protein BASA81_013749 [Batrachochytrium salamandrivorans]|nr:hypothetical protein BASA81_013749 [Batrachochytrium salamandrivorans]
MAPLIGREVASCAACFNFSSFVMLLVATISPTWSWGNVFVAPNLVTSGNIGPWVAGQMWANTVAVPCVCNAEGICFSSCPAVVTGAALWRDLSVLDVCEPLSQVFVEWSGPMGYCQFPQGFAIPSFPPLPPNAVGYGRVTGNIPAGTTFSAPSNVIAVEALIVTATVLTCLASLMGCMDATSDSAERIKPVTALALVFSILGWATALPTYAIWSSIPVVQSLLTSPPQVSIPVWTSGTLVAVSAQTFHYGASWGLALAATVFTFVASLIHALALIGMREPEFGASTGSASPAATPAAVPKAMQSSDVPPAIV